MKDIIAKLVTDFEQGKLDRRQLIQSLALTTTAAITGATIGAPAMEAAAPEGKVFKAVGVDHISYRVADYRKTRDLYSGLFGMKVTKDDGKQCSLSFGNTTIIARNSTEATPLVDHFALIVEDYDNSAVEAELKRRGLTYKPEGENSRQFRDADNYHVQLVSKKA